MPFVDLQSQNVLQLLENRFYSMNADNGQARNCPQVVGVLFFI